MKQVLSLGAGVFFNQIGFFVLAIVMNLSLRYYGNSLDISIFGVFSLIYVFATMPFLGLAQGIQPIIGYNLGAKKYQRVFISLKKSLIFSICIGFAIFLVIICFPTDVLRLFTKEPMILNEGIFPLRTAMLITPLIGIQILGYFFFLAINQPFKSLFISLSRQAIFTLMFVIIFPPFIGKIGVWVVYPVADIFSVGIAFIMTKQEINKIKEKNILMGLLMESKQKELIVMHINLTI